MISPARAHSLPLPGGDRTAHVIYVVYWLRNLVLWTRACACAFGVPIGTEGPWRDLALYHCAMIYQCTHTTVLKTRPFAEVAVSFAEPLVRRGSDEPRRTIATPSATRPVRLSYDVSQLRRQQQEAPAAAQGAFGSASPLLADAVEDPLWYNAWEDELPLPRPAQEALRHRSGARAADFSDRAAGLGDRRWSTDAADAASNADVSVSGVLEPTARRTPGVGSSGRPPSLTQRTTHLAKWLCGGGATAAGGAGGQRPSGPFVAAPQRQILFDLSGRVLPGGERKRVSVGHELLINPAVLMLDEPTSGLDSTTALHLVQLLRQHAVCFASLPPPSAPSPPPPPPFAAHNSPTSLPCMCLCPLLLLPGQLAAGGRAIITTIHQPSSRLYRQLDRVMLLAEGHIMYYGDANLARAAEWFGYFGFGLPYGVSLADFILDCATGEVVARQEAADQAASGFSRRTSTSAPPALVIPRNTDSGGGGGAGTQDQRASSPPASAAKPAQTPLRHRRRVRVCEGLTGRAAMLSLYSTFEAWYSEHPDGLTDLAQLEGVEFRIRGADGSSRYGCGGGTAAAGAPAEEGGGGGGGGGGNFLSPISRFGGGGGSSGKQDPIEIVRRCRAFTRRPRGTPETLNYHNYHNYHNYLSRRVHGTRFESLSAQNLLQMLAVAVITGLLWFQRGRGSQISAGADVMGLLFFELLFPSFRSLFSALFTFPNEYRMLKKERPAGMYRLSAYYLARTASDLPIELMYPTLFVTSWGLLFGGTFMDPKSAQTITTVVMLTFLLVGGFYVKKVPVWIGWIKYLSFLYWGFNLLLKIQFRHVDYFDGGVRVGDVKSALGLPADPNSNVLPDVLVLLAMLVALRALSYIVLRIKTEIIFQGFCLPENCPTGNCLLRTPHRLVSTSVLLPCCLASVLAALASVLAAFVGPGCAARHDICRSKQLPESSS
ncbi:hypothetical protein VOLCADRAFT_104378 [Volvox carteri f. nagariensis]|uniref:ABC-2 type transporter transmembrane domain-containing protein n=1 Tax=Volvox carteri f. nagariensis TaxID=3068 RepID=D8TTC3_VOLCA|nr:uncharacterized protein VOLCADRAFT_104378 [Volvox carteri f. nagariensis]EFJ49175.1 hypothetical protein VOLCADRAFT_104378 [Volvox carteri f. nagariensis]|eukprot:XP_002949623.1 hypothetical protein VOLCADRAFT_104378 [Volvox carteri f. nagariensis]